MTAQNWPKGASGEELRKALLPDETVLDWAPGKGESFLVATDQRALIVKVGIATGKLFGRQVNAYPYQQLTAVDLQTGVFDGYVQLGTGGAQTYNIRSRMEQMQTANSVAFNKREEGQFRALVALLRQKIQETQSGALTARVTPTGAAPTIPDQIAQLAALRDQGILSADEFERKKADLLSRM